MGPFYFLLCASLLSVQSRVLKYHIIFHDPDRDEPRGDAIPVVVYFPDAITLQVPMIMMAHGQACSGEWYEYLANALVPAGYVFASIDSWWRAPFGDYQKLAVDQQFAITALLNQSATNKTSPIYGYLNGKRGCMGHSAGGAGTVLSASKGFCDAAATVSADYSHPDEMPPVSTNIQIPWMVLTGSEDCICPPDQHGWPLYQDLGSKCKYYVDITNGTHCHFMLEPPLWEFGCYDIGEHNCRPYAIPRDDQLMMTSKYVVPWFDYALKGKATIDQINAMLKGDFSDGLVTFANTC